MAGIFDPHLILRVRREATREEIKRSYRRMVARYHPDVCDAPDAAEKFRMVVAAYESLEEQRKRRGTTGKVRYPRAAANIRPQAQHSPRPHTRYSMNLQQKMDRLSLRELITRFEGSQNRFVKMAAARALGHRHCLAAVHALSRYAASCRERDLLLGIISALGESRVPRAAYTLAPFLSHHDSLIVTAVEQALNTLKAEVTVPILERLLHRGPLIFRARMVRVLRRVLRFAST